MEVVSGKMGKSARIYVVFWCFTINRQPIFVFFADRDFPKSPIQGLDLSLGKRYRCLTVVLSHELGCKESRYDTHKKK